MMMMIPLHCKRYEECEWDPAIKGCARRDWAQVQPMIYSCEGLRRDPVDFIFMNGDLDPSSVNIDDSSTSFFVNSRTLMGCTDPLRRGVGAPHQCPLESVASYLIHADVRAILMVLLAL